MTLAIVPAAHRFASRVRAALPSGEAPSVRSTHVKSEPDTGSSRWERVSDRTIKYTPAQKKIIAKWKKFRKEKLAGIAEKEKKATLEMLKKTAMTPAKRRAAEKKWAAVRAARRKLDSATRDARGVRFMSPTGKRRKKKATSKSSKSGGPISRTSPATPARSKKKVAKKKVAKKKATARRLSAGAGKKKTRTRIAKKRPSVTTTSTSTVRKKRTTKRTARGPTTTASATVRKKRTTKRTTKRTAKTRTAKTRTAKTRTAKTRTAKTRTAKTRTAKTRTRAATTAAHVMRKPPAEMGGMRYRDKDGSPYGWESESAMADSFKIPKGQEGRERAARTIERGQAGRVVTARQILEEAHAEGLKAWVCVGPSRTGCGGGSMALRGGRQAGRLR